MAISMTVVLIAVNVLIFFIVEIMGDSESAHFMVQSGAIYPPHILEDGEYWRLLTATFLHFGGSHLLNNMVMLGAAGQILERAIGKWKFLLLYLIAGIGGSALSYWEMVHTGEYAVSAGASGAVFGIIGALVWVVIRNKGKYETLTGKGMLIMVALCLYYGVTAGNVDNWGHIGGFIMGFVMSIIFYRSSIKKIDFAEQNLYTYTYEENRTGEVEDED